MDRVGQKATTDLRAALEHAKNLLQDNPGLAEEQTREILKKYPDEPNALMVLGSALRRLNRLDEAQAVLEAAVLIAPTLAWSHQEIGLLYLETRQIEQALLSLRKAVEIEPKLPMAWKAIGDILTVQGDEEGARDAIQKHLATTVKDRELLQAAEFLYAGKLNKAETICRDVLKKRPTNVTAIRMLADIGIQVGAFEDAENLLERCLELAPDFAVARTNYANVLFKRNKFEAALSELDTLSRIDPDNPANLVLRANILARIGSYDEAIEIFADVIARFPRQAQIHLNHGHSLKTVGRLEEAVAAYRAALSLDPGLGEAYWSMANLKTFQFESSEIEAMRREIRSEKQKPSDHFHLCFSLGKSLEDAEKYDEAFEFYRRGNATRRPLIRYNARENHQDTQGLMEFFTADFFADRDGQGCTAPDPIFIVGLPRSGSTLLEQILASHSRVEGTMELPDIISIARNLGGGKRDRRASQYPVIVETLSATDLTDLGKEYLERTKIHRNGLPCFIDKMPNNFSHIGLIQLILPNAKIIDARRHPLGCCFSGYKQLFARGQNFTYDLTDIGLYYRDYVELMDHWDKVLPGRVLRVQYEDVVADLEGEVRRILDYCDLPFEDDCLRFYDTERAVRTASSEQVRRPVYQEGVEQWRHFLPHLDPLIAALGPVLERYPIN